MPRYGGHSFSEPNIGVKFALASHGGGGAETKHFFVTQRYKITFCGNPPLENTFSLFVCLIFLFPLDSLGPLFTVVCCKRMCIQWGSIKFIHSQIMFYNRSRDTFTRVKRSISDRLLFMEEKTFLGGGNDLYKKCVN